MDHAHIKGTRIFLILMDLFSEWPEVITFVDRKATTIKTNNKNNIFKEWGTSIFGLIKCARI